MEAGQSRSMTARVRRIGERVLAGGTPTFEEAVELFERSDYDVYELFQTANRLRLNRFGNRIHLCGIVNARSGGCPEDCSFCSQSVRQAADVTRYDVIASDGMVMAARRARAYGATALGVVTAGRGYTAPSEDFCRLVEGIRAITRDGMAEAHASLGMMGDEEFRQLKAAGLTTFNHNLETGRSYFPNICTTHTYDERSRPLRRPRPPGSGRAVEESSGWGRSPGIGPSWRLP